MIERERLTISEIESRINQAEKILADPEQVHISITDIAYDIGYDCLRTFNKNFKEVTDMNPREYRAFNVQFRRLMGMTPEEYQQMNNS